jgi:hypothetical protein
VSSKHTADEAESCVNMTEWLPWLASLMAIWSSLIDATPDSYKEIGWILHPTHGAILVM